MSLRADIERLVINGATEDDILDLVDSRAAVKRGRVRHAEDISVEPMRWDQVEADTAVYKWLEDLAIASAPRTITTHRFGEQCIVVRGYWACPGERLLRLTDSDLVLRDTAKRRFAEDMGRLFDHGKAYPYIRGDAHWLVSETTGTIVLSPWLLSDADPVKRDEYLASIERTFARH